MNWRLKDLESLPQLAEHGKAMDWEKADRIKYNRNVITTDNAFLTCWQNLGTSTCMTSALNTNTSKRQENTRSTKNKTVLSYKKKQISLSLNIIINRANIVSTTQDIY